MNDTPSFEAYKAEKLSEGFDEVAERQWPPGSTAETHDHPFSVAARVVRGDMWLEVAGQTRHLRAGDSFELAQGEPHSERYGPDGAIYWAARRHG